MRVRDPAEPIEICNESLGDPEHPTLLLVMGLGLTMDWWPEEFCGELVARGFHVVRFDNRDVGRSTHFRGGGISVWGLVHVIAALLVAAVLGGALLLTV